MTLPTDATARKNVPIVSGCFDYFPDALAEVARVSKAGNDQHNPGEPLHWAREKSTDEADCIGRHLLQRGTIDTDGQRHSAKMAWRALALLQKEIEADEKLVASAYVVAAVTQSQRCSQTHPTKNRSCSRVPGHPGNHQAFTRHDENDPAGPIVEWL